MKRQVVRRKVISAMERTEKVRRIIRGDRKQKEVDKSPSFAEPL